MNISLNKEKIRNMDFESRHFIGEMINFFNFQLGKQNYSIEIFPKTLKAFHIKLAMNNEIKYQSFAASDVKGPKGIFKIAKMI